MMWTIKRSREDGSKSCNAQKKQIENSQCKGITTGSKKSLKIGINAEWDAYYNACKHNTFWHINSSNYICNYYENKLSGHQQNKYHSLKM